MSAGTGTEGGSRVANGLAASFAVLTACLLTFAPSALAAAPTIVQSAATDVSTEAATLKAVINPGGKFTNYHFEYGFAPCSEVPNPCTKTAVEGIPAGTEPVKKVQPIGPLTHSTAYFFRVIVKNNEGEVKGPDKAFTTLFVLPPFPLCPDNDELRKGPTGKGPSLRLPDCRAYERSSPQDKNGTSVAGELPPLRASEAGDGIVFESSSPIPGGEGGQNFPYYLARRDAEDWSTQGLLPKGDAGDAAKVTGWTRDLSWSYSRVRKTSKDTQAYLARSSDGGALETIVEYADQGVEPGSFFFAGASADGSKVYFEATGSEQAHISPDAIEGRNNLYAWDRESDEVHLAGVLPDGSTPPGGSLAGPYDWVLGTKKGTLASGGSSRAYYVQDDHAVSEDGNRAFFTAADTGQLYLREEATEPSAATLHVSKSLKTEGKGPNGTDAAGTRPAAFMAATPDGSHAFFTSSEKLTNDATTGPEPDVFAAIARAKVTPEPPSEVDIGCLPTAAQGVDLDSEYVYWTDPKEGRIGRAKLDPSCDKESIEANFLPLPDIEVEPDVFVPANPQDVAVDSEHIYWTDPGELDEEGEAQAGKGTIGIAEIDGTSPGICVTGAGDPEGIDVGATHVYWTNAVKDVENNGTIGRAEIGTCAKPEMEFIKPIFSNQVPRDVAVNATHIYWTMSESSFANLKRTPLNEPKTQTPSLGLGFFEAKGVAVDANHVYWADGANNSIGRADLDLDKDDKKFIEGAGSPEGLAVNANHLYWAANQEAPVNPGNDLYRYDTESEGLIDLVGNGPAPNGAEVRGLLGIAEDGSRAYFVANGVLDEDATQGDCKGAPVGGTGACNLYLWEEGVPGFAFIARLQTSSGSSTDAANWAATSIAGFNPPFQKTSRTSADGSVLVFRSTRQLTPYENEGTAQFYRYDADEDSLLCLTCNPTGALPSSSPTLGSINAYLSGSTAGPPASTLSRNLSADGKRFFFETTEALLGADTNGLTGCPDYRLGFQDHPSCRDVYMWEANGTGSCEEEEQNGGCLYLLSSGTEAKPSFFADASASGADAFLITGSPGLVFEDKDELFDVYDARVEGGLQAQNELPPVRCAGESACKPGPKSPLAEEAPTTPGFQGPGDPTPKRKGCPKGKRKVTKKGKTRCVPKHKKGAKGKQGRHNRGTETSGRAGR